MIQSRQIDNHLKVAQLSGSISCTKPEKRKIRVKEDQMKIKAPTKYCVKGMVL